MNPLAVALIQIAISVIITAIITRLSSSKGIKAQNLDDFTFPTVSADRSIPVVFGDVKVEGPNVLWYGDFHAHADEEGGSFFSDAVVVGYQYKLGFEIAISWGPLTSLTELWFGEDLAYDALDTNKGGSGAALAGTVGPVVFQVSANELFGGNKNGGGVSASCEFFSGHVDQPASTYMTGQVGDAFAHSGMAKVIWKGQSANGSGSVGESTSIPPMMFRVQHYPNLLATAYKKIGTGDQAGANPAEVLYFLLIGAYINVQSGTPSVPSIPEDLIDKPTFIAAAATLNSEYMGISFQWQRDAPVREIINDILLHIDGYLSENAITGKVRLVLNRYDYNPAIIPVFDESNIVEFTSYVRINPTAAANKIVATYTDPVQDWKQIPINVEDLGNIFEQDMGSPVELDLHMFHNADTAIQRATWHLVQLSEGIVSGTFISNRAAYALNIGQAIKLNWPEFGVTDLVVRVIQKQLGGLEARSIEIKFVQDVFGIGTAVYGAPTSTAWQDIFTDPVDMITYKFFEMPYYLYAKYYVYFTTHNYHLFLLGQFPTGDTLGYDPYVSLGTAAYQKLANSVKIANPTVFVLEKYEQSRGPAKDASTGLLLTGTVPKDMQNVVTFANINANFLHFIMVGDEIMSFESYTNNSDGSCRLWGVYRGLLDTVPKTHAVGARVWFLGNGLRRLEKDFSSTQALNVKTTTFTSLGFLDLANAVAKPWTMAARYDKPLPPANVTINGSYYPTAIVGDLTITWVLRSRLITNLTQWTDATQTPEVNQTVTLNIYGQHGQLIKNVPTAVSPYVYTQVTEIAETPYINDRLTVELSSVRDGVTSFQTFSYTFNRTITSVATALVMNLSEAIPAVSVAAVDFDLTEVS